MISHRLKQTKLHLLQLQNSISAKKNINEIQLDADIVDINSFGIKVKLNKPLSAHFSDRIKFELILPESGSTLTIRGLLKDYQENNNQKTNPQGNISVDEVVYDCLKLSDTTLLIKTV